MPLVLASAIDDGIVARDAAFLVRAALLIVGLTLLQGGFTFVRAYVVQALAERVGFDLRNELYAHLQSVAVRLLRPGADRAADVPRHRRHQQHPGDAGDVDARAGPGDRHLRRGRGHPVPHRRHAGGPGALAPLPFLVWYSVRFGIAIRPMFLKVQQQFGVMTSALQENVAGGRVVRAFAQEQAEERPLRGRAGRAVRAEPARGQALVVRLSD